MLLTLFQMLSLPLLNIILTNPIAIISIINFQLEYKNIQQNNLTLKKKKYIFKF